MTGLLDSRYLHSLCHSAIGRIKYARYMAEGCPAERIELVYKGTTVSRGDTIQRCKRTIRTHDAGTTNACGVGGQRPVCPSSVSTTRRIHIASREGEVIVSSITAAAGFATTPTAT